jgi:formylglycine-generating enzyme required for sulfatase activity
MQEVACSSARTKLARPAVVRRAAPTIVPIAHSANPNKIQRFAIKRSLTVVAGAAMVALAASIFCGEAAGAAGEIQSFRDCPQCPEMVRVPSGTFVMGPQPGEEEDEQVPDDWRGVAGSPRLVNITADFAVSRYPVTRGQFRAFASAVGFTPKGGCVHFDGAHWRQEPEWNWDRTSFDQTDDHPVVCVSWFDARHYIGWLNEKTGQHYRLLSETEWEYAARAGSKARRYWGDDVHHQDQCEFANSADRQYAEAYPADQSANRKCTDGYVHTSPVGTYVPNSFALYDMLGNVNTWLEDCFEAGVSAATGNAAADCPMRILRGGAWSDPSWGVRAADRYRDVPATRCMGIGLRIARDVIPQR